MKGSANVICDFLPGYFMGMGWNYFSEFSKPASLWPKSVIEPNNLATGKAFVLFLHICISYIFYNISGHPWMNRLIQDNRWMDKVRSKLGRRSLSPTVSRHKRPSRSI